jgi:hypothetical protein
MQRSFNYFKFRMSIKKRIIFWDEVFIRIFQINHGIGFCYNYKQRETLAKVRNFLALVNKGNGSSTLIFRCTRFNSSRNFLDCGALWPSSNRRKTEK